MDVNDLKNLTGWCGSGPKDNRKSHTVIRASTNNFGTVELLINVTELNKAIASGAYTFTSKAGNQFLPLKPNPEGNLQWKKTNETPKEQPKAEDINDDIPW